VLSALRHKAVKFAKEYDTTMQIVEAFVWTFGDSNSILLSSLLLVLLFADMPFIGSGTPFYLMRIDRRTWLTGQALYIAGATLLTWRLSWPRPPSSVCAKVLSGICGAKGGDPSAIPVQGKPFALPALVRRWKCPRLMRAWRSIRAHAAVTPHSWRFIMLVFNLAKGQLAGV
jgi:hypothetical protein